MRRLPIWLLLAACATVAPAKSGNRRSGIMQVCNAAAPKLREFGTSKFVLMMTLDNRGRVESFKTEAPKGLRLEKVKDLTVAIREIQFKPAEKDGTPVAVQVKMAFDCADELTDAPKH